MLLQVALTQKSEEKCCLKDQSTNQLPVYYVKQQYFYYNIQVGD